MTSPWPLVCVRIERPSDLEMPSGLAMTLAGHHRPFAMLLVVATGDPLEEHFDSNPDARALMRGNRAFLGAWCRGVAYVFEHRDARAANHRHVLDAPFLWGTHVRHFERRDAAAAWLGDRLAA